jgi:hypothetical protein
MATTAPMTKLLIFLVFLTAAVTGGASRRKSECVKKPMARCSGAYEPCDHDSNNHADDDISHFNRPLLAGCDLTCQTAGRLAAYVRSARMISISASSARSFRDTATTGRFCLFWLLIWPSHRLFSSNGIFNRRGSACKRIDAREVRKYWSVKLDPNEQNTCHNQTLRDSPRGREGFWPPGGR